MRAVFQLGRNQKGNPNRCCCSYIDITARLTVQLAKATTAWTNWVYH